MTRVAIVGAGVIGLTASVHLLQRFPGKLDLTLLADKFSPDTVSDKSTWLFLPLVRPITAKTKSNCAQDEEIKRWMRTSFSIFQSIFSSEDNAQVGISLVYGYMYFSKPLSEPWWKDLMFGSRRVDMESAEAKNLSVPSDCVDIWTFGTYSMNPTNFLQWLMGKAKKNGCTVEKKMISSLDELTSSYDIVIKCTGLSSCKELFDSKMYPIRGQAVIVKAPWVKHWVVHLQESEVHHSVIVPRGSEVVLGGTAEVGHWNESTDPDTIRDIIKRCQDLVPSLRGAEVVGDWAGLRPGRDHIRLEGCACQGGNLLIHCYGHGGSGVTLSWGCAVDIGDMVEQKLTSM